MEGNFNHTSKTGWEHSYFGGYIRLLNDFPEIKIDSLCKVEISSKSILGYSLGHKLIRLFILRIYEFDLFEDLIVNSRFHVSDEKKFLMIDKDSITQTLSKLIVTDNELNNLFEYYKNEIADASILLKLKDDIRSPLKSIKETTKEIVIKHQLIIDEQFNKKDVVNKDDSNDETENKEIEKIEKAVGVSLRRNKIANHFERPVFRTVIKSSKLIYRPSELREINRLVDRLDISFDPDDDEIKGLRQGKIDTNKLAEVLAFNDRIYSRIIENQKTKPFKVIVLCDESGSMNENLKYKKQFDLVKILYGAFSKILPIQDISIYGHTGEYNPEIFIYHDMYNPNFDYSISNMLRTKRQNNYDGLVIDAIYNRTRKITNEPILMIIISDGQPAGYGYGDKADIDDMIRIIEKCKRDNFIIMGIGFEYDGVQDLYYYHAIINNMDKMVEATTVLLNKVVETEFK